MSVAELCHVAHRCVYSTDAISGKDEDAGSTSTTRHEGVPFHAYTGPGSGRMPRILTGVSGVCSAKPTERMKPGCTPVYHVTSGVGVPPGGTTGCAHQWHGIADALRVVTRAHGFMPAAPGVAGDAARHG